ncbi:FAD-binding oxidoreductase [Nisaea denitrificans]|uniref:FAD-binding oxidoreductase n=1 Tax=Nisaea denitrificans TaxID=390877 RepID=UPI00042A3470|nr:FAD-binding oxidoreductase [Nisaea denitrificans]
MVAGTCRSAGEPVWSDIVGPENVILDADQRDAWGCRTFGADMAVSAILRPGSRHEISAILRAATEHRLPVHPVSRGANWGMGSRAPFENGSVILDLSGLVEISGYDPVQGLVRVEPGVTFGMLAAYLAERESRYFVPEIGGSPEASVLANALDRGDGSIGDRWASLGDLEVVLADGRTLETGYSATEAYRLTGLHSGAAGPIIEGLFSQSNLGVVVAAWIRLEPMPGNLAIFTSRIDSLKGLPELISTWREAQRSGAVQGRSVTLWNGVKYLARENPRSFYFEDEVRLAETETWHLSGYLQAEDSTILGLRGDRVIQSFNAAGAETSGMIVRTDAVWQDGCEGLLGKPSPRNLRTVYWSSDSIPGFEDMDPDADRCGLLWLCLAFPFDGEVLADFVRCAAEVLRPYGIDLNIGVEATSFRCLLSYISLSYRRAGPESDAAALDAYRALLAEAERMGLAPYRLANGLAKTTATEPSSLQTYLEEIRAVGDPNGILSKGRADIG